MLTSKERSKLSSFAMNVPVTVQIGKNGITKTVVEQINQSLEDHELIKIGVLKSTDVSAKDIVVEVAKLVNADIVQTIGNKIVLYRMSHKENIEHIRYKF